MACVGGKQLGTGYGESMILAKHDAAVKSLMMLNPSIVDAEETTMPGFESDLRFSDMLLRIWMVDDRINQPPAFEFDRFSDGSYCAQGRIVVNNTTLPAGGRGSSMGEAKHDASKLLFCKLFPEASNPEEALEAGAKVVQEMAAATQARQRAAAAVARESEATVGAGREVGYAYGGEYGNSGRFQGGEARGQGQGQGQDGLGTGHAGVAGPGKNGANVAAEPDVMAQHYAGYIDPSSLDPTNFEAFDAGFGLRASAPVFYAPTSAPNTAAFSGAMSPAMAMTQASTMVQSMEPLMSMAGPSMPGVQPPPPPPGPPPLGQQAPTYPGGNPNYSGVESPGVPPANYLCPISGRLMTQPVLANDGWAYEHVSLANWIRTALAANQVPYSPFNGMDLSQTQMQPHYALQVEIQRWYTANAEYCHQPNY